MNLSLDLNADLGEGGGNDAELLQLVTSANVACGFHAGNLATMRATLIAAREAHVSVGAHPSFEDRENFGRNEVTMMPNEISALVAYQIGAFGAVAASLDVLAQHVKPHGALYNMAVRDEAIADAIARAVSKFDSTLIIFAPGESMLARVAKARGIRVASEVFADRNYLADGSLVPRSRPDALLHDPVEAAQRVFRMLSEGKVRAVDGADVVVRADTVCIHGDTPGAVEFARALRVRLVQAGVVVGAPKTA